MTSSPVHVITTADFDSLQGSHSCCVPAPLSSFYASAATAAGSAKLGANSDEENLFFVLKCVHFDVSCLLVPMFSLNRDVTQSDVERG